MFKYGTGPTHRQTKQARLRDGCAPKFFVSLPNVADVADVANVANVADVADEAVVADVADDAVVA